MSEKAIQSFDRELVAGTVKAAMSEAGAKSRDLWQVPLHAIHVIEGFNLRVDDDALKAHIRNLAESIKQNGFYQDKPLAGYVANEDGQQIIYVTEGHCRLAAARIAASEGADLLTLPMAIKDRSVSMEALTVALVKSNEGKPFTPAELSVVAARLQGFGRTEAEIARLLGFTPTYVRDLLSLAGAPRQVRKMVQEGELSASLAVQQLRQHGSKVTEVLEAASKTAKASGKKKVTAKALPGKEREKYVRKHAAAAFKCLAEVLELVSPEQIPVDLLEKIRTLDDGLPNA